MKAKSLRLVFIDAESANQSLVPYNKGIDMKHNVYLIRITFAYIVVNVAQEKINTNDIFKTVWGSKRKLQKNLSVKPAIKFFSRRGNLERHCSLS